MKNYSTTNPSNYFNRLSEIIKVKQPDNWMKTWMEEADNYKNNPEALKLIENDVDGFLHYMDVVESNDE